MTTLRRAISRYTGDSMNKRMHGMTILLCACMSITTLVYCLELWRNLYRNYSNHSLSVSDDYENDSEYLIATIGCHIPRTEMNFTNLVVDNPSLAAQVTCGIPLVSVSNDVEGHVELNVINSTLLHYFNNTSDFSHCCYRIVSRVNDNDKNISMSSCYEFRETTIVESSDDFMSVECFAKNGARVYNDNLAVVRKKTENRHAEEGWSVLVLGVDTMSRARLQKEMPTTAAYFRENDWLDFQGYQKVADNTFPNLMTVLTGNNDSYSYGSCQSKIDQCNKLMIWSLYKDNNYVTAYGEDHLKLPDTFSQYKGFIKPPTDHYMRPFFLIGEKEMSIDGFKVICSGSKMVGERVIDYASDFAQTYINDTSFGFFWMNSFSHNPVNSPLVMDSKITSMLKTLANIGVMKNTFVIFLSDHGIRFGESRKQVESYYEERLPSFLMWVPPHFRELYPKIYEMLRINTLRLVTPYDLYMTLQDILHLSTDKNKYQIEPANGCPTCKSLFQEVDPGRTCQDASVTSKWCTCHKLEPAELKRSHYRESIKSIDFVIRHLNNITGQCETDECTYCAKYDLDTIVRTHFYTDSTNKEKYYYVVAFSVNPGNHIYEVTVSRDKKRGLEIVGKISFISKYSGSGNCAKKANYRAFCHCVHIDNSNECSNE